MSDLELNPDGGSVEVAPQADWAHVARNAAQRRVKQGEKGTDEDAVLRELLVFGLKGAAYAIDVERVREIVRSRALTRIPRAPEWLLGVMALRGEVVEVMDLRLRLGLAASEPGRSQRIIVLHGEADRVMGLLVDSVSEVYRVAQDRMIPAQGLDGSNVSEMCPRGDDFVSILDLERALGVKDV